MKRIIAIAFLLLAVNAYSCLNIFAVDSTGRVHYLEHYFFFPIEFKQEQIAKSLKQLERKFNKNDYSFKNISDYGAYLLMAGHFNEGLTLFRALSKKYPDVYEIRANTAVAYELNGNIDSAYLWEAAAIKLRSTAHNNSEWIHLKILEAKKKLLYDPDWCLNNNVTGIIDSIKLHYKFTLHEDGKGMWILNHFIIQLQERFPFTYGEDKAMGKLMFELGDAYQAVSIYRSYHYYAIAKYLYPALGLIADEKMKLIRLKYPTGSAIVEGKTVSLPSQARSEVEKEMLPPDDSKVKEFINEIINRPSIKNNKIGFINTEQLLRKI